ncbi:MAG: hypothetical protein AAF266_09455 [Planctomycetota bacterium]
MSMGPLGGIVSSAAGTALSQTKGASTEREATEAAARDKADELDLRAEKSSGVGQTEGDAESSDRDADGRRLWEQQQERDKEDPGEEAADEVQSSENDEDGGHLDLIA